MYIVPRYTSGPVRKCAETKRRVSRPIAVHLEDVREDRDVIVRRDGAGGPRRHRGPLDEQHVVERDLRMAPARLERPAGQRGSGSAGERGPVARRARVLVHRLATGELRGGEQPRIGRRLRRRERARPRGEKPDGDEEPDGEAGHTDLDEPPASHQHISLVWVWAGAL
jgi:hypothetical protein